MHPREVESAVSWSRPQAAALLQHVKDHGVSNGNGVDSTVAKVNVVLCRHVGKADDADQDSYDYAGDVIPRPRRQQQWRRRISLCTSSSMKLAFISVVVTMSYLLAQLQPCAAVYDDASDDGWRRKRGLAESSSSSASNGKAKEPLSLVFDPASSTLDYYDQLRRSSEARFAGGLANSQLVRVPDPDEPDRILDILHLSTFIDLTLRVKSNSKEEAEKDEDGGLDLRGWSSAFSVVIAVHHWNNNIADIAPVIAEVRGRRCPNLRFTTEFFNTAFSPIVAARRMVEEIFPRVRHGEIAGDNIDDGTSGTTEVAAAATNSSTRPAPPDPKTDYPIPIAIIGSTTSIESATLAALTSTVPLPQVAHAATSPGLDNPDEYPLFGRVVPNSRGDSRAAVDYFVRVLGATHVAVLHVRDQYGSEYASAFRQAGLESDPPLQVVSTSFSQGTGIPDREDMRVAISTLKETGFRYFFGVLFPKHVKVVMSEATSQGIVGDDYLWIFGDALMGDTTTEEVPNDSVLAKAMMGIGILHVAPILTSDDSDVGSDGQDGGPLEFLRHRDEWIKSEEVKAYFREKVYEFEDDQGTSRRRLETSNGKERPGPNRGMAEASPSEGTTQRESSDGEMSSALSRIEANKDSKGVDSLEVGSRLLIDAQDLENGAATVDCADEFGSHLTELLNEALSDGSLDVPSGYFFSNCGADSSSIANNDTEIVPDRYFAFDLTFPSSATKVNLVLNCDSDISVTLSLRVYQKGSDNIELSCVDRIESTCSSIAVSEIPAGEYVFLLHGSGDTERAGFDLQFDCVNNGGEKNTTSSSSSSSKPLAETPPVATKHASLYDSLMYDAVISLALAICTGFEMDRPFDPYFLYETFATNTSFYGATSFVEINNITGSREFRTVSYAISNLIIDTVNMTTNTTKFAVNMASRYSIVDANTIAGEWQTIKPFVYHDGSTIPPVNLPKVDVTILSLSTGAKVFGLILCGLLLMITIGFSVWTVIHRKTAIVRASQPFFLQIVSAGSFLMALTIIPMSFTASENSSQRGLDVACMFAPWFFELGFVTVFSALFSKLWRVNKLFQDAARFSRVTVRVRDVMIPFSSLLLLTVSILISWTIVAPLKYRRIDTSSKDKFGRVVSVVEICAPDPESGNMALAFASSLVAIDALVLFFANYQAFKARKIAVDFSESRFIAMAMKIMMEGILIGVPVLVTIPSEPSPQFITRSVMVAVICLAVVLSTFVPKLVYLKGWIKEQKKKEERKSERLKRREEYEARVISSGMGWTLGSTNAGSSTNTTHFNAGSSLANSYGPTELRRSNMSSMGL